MPAIFISLEVGTRCSGVDLKTMRKIMSLLGGLNNGLIFERGVCPFQISAADEGLKQKCTQMGSYNEHFPEKIATRGSFGGATQGPILGPKMPPTAGAVPRSGDKYRSGLTCRIIATLGPVIRCCQHGQGPIFWPKS